MCLTKSIQLIIITMQLRNDSTEATAKEVIGVEERKMLQTMEEAARLMSPQKQAEFVAFCEGMAFVARQQAGQAERKQ